MRRPLLALVVLLALVAGACSSGGDDDSSTSTSRSPGSSAPAQSAEFEAYADQASQVCYDAKQKFRFTTGSAVRFVDALVDAAETGSSGIQALEPPDDQRDEIQQNLVTPYVAANQVVIDSAVTMREAAAASPEAFTTAFGTTFITSLQKWTLANTRWLRANGLADCAPDLDGLLRAE